MVSVSSQVPICVYPSYKATCWGGRYSGRVKCYLRDTSKMLSTFKASNQWLFRISVCCVWQLHCHLRFSFDKSTSLDFELITDFPAAGTSHPVLLSAFSYDDSHRHQSKPAWTWQHSQYGWLSPSWCHPASKAVGVQHLEQLVSLSWVLLRFNTYLHITLMPQ